MSRLIPWIGGTRRLVGHVGEYGMLLGPFRRAVVEPAAPANDEALRLLICYHGKRLWQAGFIAGPCGNLSARLHNRDAIYITPKAMNKARLRTADIRLVPLRGAPEGPTGASVELPMHRACYLADVGVGAVAGSDGSGHPRSTCRRDAARGCKRAWQSCPDSPSPGRVLGVGRIRGSGGCRGRAGTTARASWRRIGGTQPYRRLRPDGVRRADREDGAARCGSERLGVARRLPDTC